jgi:hypothetical protein
MFEREKSVFLIVQREARNRDVPLEDDSLIEVLLLGLQWMGEDLFGLRAHAAVAHAAWHVWDKPRLQKTGT